jgi:phytoene dehydrogenase-like protein
VLVLEASDTAGGLAAIREFHPGFHVSVAQSVSHFPQQIVDDLKLSSHGFEAAQEPLATIGLSGENKHVVIDASGVSGVGDEDVASYQSYSKIMQRFAKVLRPFWLKTMPRIGSAGLSGLLTLGRLGLGIRMLGRRDMQELLRVASLPARDLMDENFDNELLKATLSWDGLVGAKLAPRSPNSAVLTMLYRMSGVSGSAKGLVDSLMGAARAAGADIRTNASVDRILIGSSEDGLVANGVQLGNGEKLEADRVISAADPKRTFLNMVGVEYLDIGFTNRIRRLRCDGYVAKLHLALSDLPKFEGLQQPDGRIIIAADMDTIEFAFDHAKYGELPESPVMEIVLPSMRDAALAPDGKHVLSANVMYVPYQLKGGWTDEARQQICNRAIDTIARYAPNIREQIIHSELLTPADLERDYRVTGGHWHHTEMAMDQMLMMRPTYEAAQYSTPIPGLFLCSAGCHPGGGLSGAAGHNAAQEILR